MYSLNVPVPGRVARLREAMRPKLTAFEVREDPSLVLKRLGSPSDAERPRVAEQVRTALAGVGPLDLTIERVGCFERPPLGAGPVVYLAVESGDLRRAHDRLLEPFPPVDGVEGDDYVPHVTLARGGDVDRARDLAGPVPDPVAWSAGELRFHDADRGGTVGRLSLPP